MIIEEIFMCGRFSLAATLKAITIRFDASPLSSKWHPRFNIAPGQTVLSIVSDQHQRSIVDMTFGFIPHWAKEKATGYTMINAKAETVAEKPSYKESFLHKRCLIPADGFYEWKTTTEGKLPYRFTLKDNSLFAFAAIWDTWKSPEGDTKNTFAIITTEGNSLTNQLHDRMPVILHQKDEATWLDPLLTKPEDLQPLLKPYPAAAMEMYAVSPMVNSWRNDTPECIKPI